MSFLFPKKLIILANQRRGGGTEDAHPVGVRIDPEIWDKHSVYKYSFSRKIERRSFAITSHVVNVKSVALHAIKLWVHPNYLQLKAASR